MGIRDIVGKLDDLDLGKVKDVVETIWDDRDKIGEVVDLVWSNRDRLVPVLDWVKEHGDDLLDLMEKVPEILGRAGQALTEAGHSATTAAGWLVGQADDGVVELVEVAAKALDSCWDELDDVAKLLRSIGDRVDDVEIPTVAPRYTEVMGFDVVTGIDFGSDPFLDGVADRLKDGADRVGGVAAGLTTVASQLRDVAARVVDAGNDLDQVGKQLDSSGSALMAMGATRPVRTRPKAKPAASKAVGRKRRA